jgi:hypothetical protein
MRKAQRDKRVKAKNVFFANGVEKMAVYGYVRVSKAPKAPEQKVQKSSQELFHIYPQEAIKILIRVWRDSLQSATAHPVIDLQMAYYRLYRVPAFQKLCIPYVKRKSTSLTGEFPV